MDNGRVLRTVCLAPRTVNCEPQFPHHHHHLAKRLYNIYTCTAYINIYNIYEFIVFIHIIAHVIVYIRRCNSVFIINLFQPCVYIYIICKEALMKNHTHGMVFGLWMRYHTEAGRRHNPPARPLARPPAVATVHVHLRFRTRRCMGAFSFACRENIRFISLVVRRHRSRQKKYCRQPFLELREWWWFLTTQQTNGVLLGSFKVWVSITNIIIYDILAWCPIFIIYFSSRIAN